MAKDDAKKVFEHLEKAKEASKPLGDPGLTKKIETAQEHIKKRVDPDQKSPKGIESTDQISHSNITGYDPCPKAFTWMNGFSRPDGPDANGPHPGPTGWTGTEINRKAFFQSRQLPRLHQCAPNCAWCKADGNCEDRVIKAIIRHEEIDGCRWNGDPK